MSKTTVHQCQASSQSGTVSVSTTAVTLAEGKIARKYLVISNNDNSNTIFIGIGRTPTTSAYDVKLSPGGHYVADYVVPVDKIEAIASSGTNNVGIYEGV